MSNQYTDKALIFAEWPDGRECYFQYRAPEEGGPPVSHAVSLAERIALVVSFMDGFIPVAWAPCGTKTSPITRAEAIAAGRTIEYEVDTGRYVPRGLPIEQEPAQPQELKSQELTQGWAQFFATKPITATELQARYAKYASSITLEAVDNLHKVMDGVREANERMIARDGAPAPSKPRDSTPCVSKALPPLPALTILGDVADPRHGSAWLVVR